MQGVATTDIAERCDKVVLDPDRESDDVGSPGLSFSQIGRPPEKKHRRLNFQPDVFVLGTIRCW